MIRARERVAGGPKNRTLRHAHRSTDTAGRRALLILLTIVASVGVVASPLLMPPVPLPPQPPGHVQTRTATPLP